MRKMNRSHTAKNRSRLILVLLLAGTMGYDAYGQQERPNIIFIMSDDHASTALGSYGNKYAVSPNIDEIAKQGIRFTNAFVISSLCTPSRAAVISGKYSAVNGVRRIGDVFNGDQETFPKMLQGAGYNTALFGKWHLTSQPTGFDKYSVVQDQGDFFDPRFFSNGQKWEEKRKTGGTVVPGYFTEIITDQAIAWLKAQKSNKPFAMLVHHKAPHEPYEFPEKYSQLFAKTEFDLPTSYNDTFSGKNTWLANGKQATSKLEYMIPKKISEGTVPIPKPADIKIGTEEYKRLVFQGVLKGYYRLGASLDDNIGRLLKYLKESGLSDNTIIVYTSDNGWFLGEHGLRNKMWMYEEALRVPLLISYPGHIKVNQVNNSLVSSLDFAPTFLDYAGVKIPDGLQGKSLKPILEGKKGENWRTAFFYHYYDQFEVPEHVGLRTQNYKLIKFSDSLSTEYELYDLKNDPAEMSNKYNDPKYSKMQRSLTKQLEKQKKRFEN